MFPILLLLLPSADYTLTKPLEFATSPKYAVAIGAPDKAGLLRLGQSVQAVVTAPAGTKLTVVRREKSLLVVTADGGNMQYYVPRRTLRAASR